MNTRGQVLHTTNGGQQWTNVASPDLTRALQHASAVGGFSLSPVRGGSLVATDGFGSSVAFPNAWTAWINIPTGNDGLQVWHTADGGQRWTATVIHRAAPGGPPMGISNIAAVGNRDAWIVAASMALAGHVHIRVWRTSVRHPGWHAVYQGTAPNTSGLAFATGSLGVLTEGSNLGYWPDNAALAVTANGGRSWSQFGQPTSPARPALPLLPGHWFTTVLAPAIVPHTQDLVVPVLMQRPFPPKTAPLKTWWRLEESSNWGQTWKIVTTTPNVVLTKPPNLIFQAWTTPQDGWVVLGSHLYRTVDGGQQWATSDLPTGMVVNLNRISATTGFVLVQRGAHTAIYCTQDGGVRWLRVS